MNKDRIQIDGVWYVREQTIPTKIEILKTKGIMTESDKYCFEATKIEKEDGTYYNDFDIEFTDKRGDVGKWKPEHWDNMNFFKGCLELNPESLGELQKCMCDRGVEEFIYFLKVLDEEGWIQSVK